MNILRSVLILASLALSTLAFAQPDEWDMGKMRMVLLRSTGVGASGAALGAKHRAEIDRLIATGDVVIAGPVEGSGDLREIVVFRTDSEEIAAKRIHALPLVATGALKPDPITWFAGRKAIQRAAMPIERTDYVFGLLVKGDAPAQSVEELKRIQEGHMANINRLAKEGKIVLAGPFVDGGDRRGVFIFKVPTLEEAQALTDTDPAVKAGRLKIELYRWSIPKGILK